MQRDQTTGADVGVYESNWREVGEIAGKLRLAMAAVGPEGAARLYIPGSQLLELARAIDDGCGARAAAARADALAAEVTANLAQAEALIIQAGQAQQRALFLAFTSAAVIVAALLVISWSL